MFYPNSVYSSLPLPSKAVDSSSPAASVSLFQRRLENNLPQEPQKNPLNTLISLQYRINLAAVQVALRVILPALFTTTSTYGVYPQGSRICRDIVGFAENNDKL